MIDVLPTDCADLMALLDEISPWWALRTARVAIWSAYSTSLVLKALGRAVLLRDTARPAVTREPGASMMFSGLLCLVSETFETVIGALTSFSEARHKGGSERMDQRHEEGRMPR